MKPASFERAETPDGLDGVIRSAITLHFCGGSAVHLCEAIAHGAGHQGIPDDELEARIKRVKEAMIPKTGA